MKEKISYNIFLTLGSIWIIIGLIVYKNPTIWPLGFIFLIIGLIGKFGYKK